MGTNHFQDVTGDRARGLLRDIQAELKGESKTIIFDPGGIRQSVRDLVTKLDDADKSLQKLNDIRNSIIGTQTINWSEHIYPMVAALNEAGMQGLDYKEAKKNVGTLIERVKAMEELWRLMPSRLMSAMDNEMQKIRNEVGL